jgi:hypothetical protein
MGNDGQIFQKQAKNKMLAEHLPLAKWNLV